VHAGTGPTLPVAKGNKASTGESVEKKNCTNDGNVKERMATDVLSARQGKADKSTTGGRITRPDWMETDWMESLTEYIKNPGSTRDRKINRQALKYTLMNDELYRWTIDGLLLKCMNEEQARIAMGEVHKGLCGTHQLAHKMKWLLKRARLYWLTMVEDCIRYQKGCDACQRFGNVQLALAYPLHPIVKPWPFRGWGLDFIGEVHPSPSKGHRFVLATTDYFVKWTEVVPL
jgi:hypothetical protein